jgi:phosphoesterase RecJ-like protein
VDQGLYPPAPPQLVRLRNMAVATIEYHAGGRVALMHVSREMFDSTGLGPPDTDGFANIPLEIRGVRAAALLKEMPAEDYIKVSLRSRDDVDVSSVARQWGGGGHPVAAGCQVREELETARRLVAERLRRLVEGA